MRLPAVVDLVLEEVREDAAHAVVHQALPALGGDGDVEVGIFEGLAERDEAPVGRELLAREVLAPIEGLLGVEMAPGIFCGTWCR